MSSETPDMQLWYGPVLIGRVTDTYYSEATWWGDLELALDPSAGTLERRLMDYIEFCEQWHERLHEWNAWTNRERTQRPESLEPDASEFDEYSDLLTSSQWVTRAEADLKAQIDQAPVFLPGRYITWRVVGEY